MLPPQIVVLPEIIPGVEGTVLMTVIDKVCGDDDPQELLAVTESVPPVVPAERVIVLVDEVPDQPEGRLQV